MNDERDKLNEALAARAAGEDLPHARAELDAALGRDAQAKAELTRLQSLVGELKAQGAAPSASRIARLESAVAAERAAGAPAVFTWWRYAAVAAGVVLIAAVATVIAMSGSHETEDNTVVAKTPSQQLPQAHDSGWINAALKGYPAPMAWEKGELVRRENDLAAGNVTGGGPNGGSQPKAGDPAAFGNEGGKPLNGGPRGHGDSGTPSKEGGRSQGEAPPRGEGGGGSPRKNSEEDKQLKALILGFTPLKPSALPKSFAFAAATLKAKEATGLTFDLAWVEYRHNTNCIIAIEALNTPKAMQYLEDLSPPQGWNRHLEVKSGVLVLLLSQSCPNAMLKAIAEGLAAVE